MCSSSQSKFGPVSIKMNGQFVWRVPRVRKYSKFRESSYKIFIHLYTLIFILTGRNLL